MAKKKFAVSLFSAWIGHVCLSWATEIICLYCLPLRVLYHVRMYYSIYCMISKFNVLILNNGKKQVMHDVKCCEYQHFVSQLCIHLFSTWCPDEVLVFWLDSFHGSTADLWWQISLSPLCQHSQWNKIFKKSKREYYWF